MIEFNNRLLEQYIYYDGQIENFWNLTISEVLFYITTKAKRIKDDFKIYGLMVEQAIINQMSKGDRIDILSKAENHSSSKFATVDDKKKELNEIYSKFKKRG